MSSACVDEDCGHFWNLQKELQKEIIPGVVLIAVYSAAAVSTVPRGSAREELTPQIASVATVPLTPFCAYGEGCRLMGPVLDGSSLQKELLGSLCYLRLLPLCRFSHVTDHAY